MLGRNRLSGLNMMHRRTLLWGGARAISVTTTDPKPSYVIWLVNNNATMRASMDVNSLT